jgi:hypothetical protein
MDQVTRHGLALRPPAKEKLVPFGILMLATGALMLLVGSAETSDAWVDALPMWWLQVRAGLGQVKSVEQVAKVGEVALDIDVR